VHRLQCRQLRLLTKSICYDYAPAPAPRIQCRIAYVRIQCRGIDTVRVRIPASLLFNTHLFYDLILTVRCRFFSSKFLFKRLRIEKTFISPWKRYVKTSSSIRGWVVGWLFAGVYTVAAAEETERACFGADFSSVHSQNDSRICLNSLARKKSSLLYVINCDFAAQPLVISLTVILGVKTLSSIRHWLARLKTTF
jgi:hypothetical protein